MRISTSKILSVIIWCITAPVSLLTLVSAYAGYINPTQWRPASLLSMTFPAWLAATVFMAVIGLLFRRKAAWMAFAAIVLSAGTVIEYCPINFSKKAKEGNMTFKLLSYNAYYMVSLMPDNPYPGDVNPAISHILSTDADIAAIQEGIPLKASESKYVTQQQIDSLEERYPYRFYTDIPQNVILSKWPFDIVEDMDTNLSKAVIAADIYIGYDTLRIYNVHLQSYELSDDDKQLYHDLANFEADKNELREARSMLIDKIVRANELRAIQADSLAAYINSHPRHNIIVTGDFNDVPGSYTLRTIADADGGLSSAYSTAGFGPMITYNRRIFPFRIDHTLYRGNLRALSCERHNNNNSDHYPLVTTFEVTTQTR